MPTKYLLGITLRSRGTMIRKSRCNPASSCSLASVGIRQANNHTKHVNFQLNLILLSSTYSIKTLYKSSVLKTCQVFFLKHAIFYKKNIVLWEPKTWEFVLAEKTQHSFPGEVK